MKRVFFFAVLASVAFAGCTFDEGVSDGAVNGNEINFAVAQYTPQTRAEHDKGVEFTNPIKVWSWYTGKDTQVIPGDVYNTSSPEGFTSGKKYYWPADGTHLDFVAVPNDCVTKGYVTAPTRTTLGATELEFSIEDTDDYHADNLMTTEVIKDQTAPAGGTMALIFRHLLSQVKINVTQAKTSVADEAAWTVTINNIDILGLHNVGDVTIDNDWLAKNADDDPVAWDNTNGDEDWDVVTASHTLCSGATKFDYVFDNYFATPYYILPQKLEAGVQQIKIDYTIVTEYANGVQPDTTQEYTKTVDFINIPGITEWYMNKIITYNISIDPSSTLNPITFNVNEEVWGEDIKDKGI